MNFKSLASYYRIDPQTGDYIIDIHLTHYEEVYNHLDFSMIRDLNPSLKDYLKVCTIDIGFNKKINLRFNLELSEQNFETETHIQKNIHAYYCYEVALTKFQFIQKIKKTVLYIPVSLSMLSVMLLLQIRYQTLISTCIPLGLFTQGLNVGGWIFLWESITILILQQHDYNLQKKIYQRLSQAPISFRLKPESFNF